MSGVRLMLSTALARRTAADGREATTAAVDGCHALRVLAAHSGCASCSWLVAAQGVQFEIFANPRIRGAMFDELRGNDWTGRGDRRHQRSIESAMHKLDRRHGRAPSEGEIACETGGAGGGDQEPSRT
jgi:hypothetical protein